MRRSGFPFSFGLSVYREWCMKQLRHLNLIPVLTMLLSGFLAAHTSAAQGDGIPVSQMPPAQQLPAAP
jgi:hypothetical protein